MALKTFRTGIVGCGGIAFGKHMPAIAKLPHVAMVAFCDLLPERAEEAREKYGAADAKVYHTYQEMMADPTIDVVHVLTPNSSHAAITIAALEAGKDVMCEKPMAKTSQEAQAMLDAARRTGRKLTIGYQNRFRINSAYLKKMCVDGELGEIYYARAKALRRRAVPTWGVFLDAEAQGGGPLIDIGTHALDLTLWEMDNYQVASVTGTVYRKLADNENAANAFGPWDPKEYTVEDSAFGFITMKNGATIFLEASWALNTLDEQEAATILCGTLAGADMPSDERLRINGEKNGKTYIFEPGLEAGGVAFYEGGKGEPSDLEAEALYEALANDTPPVVLPEQALVVTQVLEAIYTSAKTGKPVVFD